MRNRRHADSLDPDEMASADQRKAIFREMARDALDDHVTDRPGAIARLAERAFRAGIEAARTRPGFDARKSDDGLNGYLTPEMIPRKSRDALGHAFLYVFGTYKPFLSYDISREHRDKPNAARERSSTSRNTAHRRFPRCSA